MADEIFEPSGPQTDPDIQHRIVMHGLTTVHIKPAIKDGISGFLEILNVAILAGVPNVIGVEKISTLKGNCIIPHPDFLRWLANEIEKLK